MIDKLDYKIKNPDISISGFVERFWTIQNSSDKDIEIVVIPDGRIDIIFTLSPNEPFLCALIGIETLPSQHKFSIGTVMFGVSLKLLAVEYLIDTSISNETNSIRVFPDDFWGINKEDLNNFENFCNKISEKIKKIIKQNIDSRKMKLFDLIYSSNGAMTVQELSEQVVWSSRQINRYFSKQFGISLKSFCKILRFRASFTHIKQGKLFPDLNFSDQAHFIKEVKKLAGVSPKELFKNQNDRFLQFSTLS